MSVAHQTTSSIRFATALGTCSVRWTERGIDAVAMPSAAAAFAVGRIAVSHADRPRRLASTEPLAKAPTDAPIGVREAIADIVALLAGEPRDLRSVALDLRGVGDFERSVYATTRAIEPGSTASYGEIAARIGAPDDARAVGAALARNPVPIIVPCHRVLAADGTLRGFSAPGGIATKRRMLEIEGAPGFTQQTLFG